MRRRKRAMLMIFVVIMIAAATTIIAASVDLGRMAIYKQKQSEREAKWGYCIESSKAMVVEDLVGLADTSQSFAATVNGVALTVTASPDLTWNFTTGCRISSTGTIDGKARTSVQYVGKRSYVNPCQFGMFFATKLRPDSTTSLTGDLFLAGTPDTSQFTIVGTTYSPNSTGPTFASQTGQFIGQQPGQHITLDSVAYAAAASVSTTGNSTLNNPTDALSLLQSQLRYHNGNLTITGQTSGEITIFVKGNVILNGIHDSSSNPSRLVVICDGTVQIAPGTIDAFVICNGKIQSTGVAGNRIVNGSLAGDEFSSTNSPYTVNFDNYFVSNIFGGFRYWIPGQW